MIPGFGLPRFDGQFDAESYGFDSSSSVPGFSDASVLMDEDEPESVYLPLTASNHIYYPPVNVREHTTGTDGVITVPVTGGRTAQFRFIDLLGDPLSGMDVVAIENQYGITLIANGNPLGYHTKIVSFHASDDAGSAHLQALQGMQDITMIPVEEVRAYAEDEDIIIEHLQALPDNMEDWERKRGTVDALCETLVENLGDPTAPAQRAVVISREIAELAIPRNQIEGIQVLSPASAGAHIVLHMYAHAIEEFTTQKCKELLGGPGPYEHRIVENSRMGAYLLTWDMAIGNENGVVFGQVADSETADGISDATVSLDDDAFTTKSLPNGWFRIEGVSPGDHIVEVTKAGYGARSATASVVEDEAVFVGPLKIGPADPGFLVIDNGTGGLLTFQVFQDDELQTELTLDVNEERTCSLPPGDYHLVAWATTCTNPGTLDITLSSGQYLNVRVVCQGNKVSACCPAGVRERPAVP